MPTMRQVEEILEGPTGDVSPVPYHCLPWDCSAGCDGEGELGITSPALSACGDSIEVVQCPQCGRWI